MPLTDQDRSSWNTGAISEGVALIAQSLTTTRVGPYQLQAAIAAVHDQAARPEDTDWPQILTLYNLLRAVAPSPMATLNRIVALAVVRGPKRRPSRTRRRRDRPNSGRALLHRRHPRPPDRTRRRARQRPHPLPTGSAAHPQRARTALPAITSRPHGVVATHQILPWLQSDV
jgi:hypothetical protein